MGKVKMLPFIGPTTKARYKMGSTVNPMEPLIHVLKANSQMLWSLALWAFYSIYSELIVAKKMGSTFIVSITVRREKFKLHYLGFISSSFSEKYMVPATIHVPSELTLTLTLTQQSAQTWVGPTNSTHCPC